MARISDLGVIWFAILLELSLLAEGHTHPDVANNGGVNLRAKGVVLSKCSALVILFVLAFSGSLMATLGERAARRSCCWAPNSQVESSCRRC